MRRLTANQFYADAESFDLARECDFFSSLKMRNGTFKFTRASRFASLDGRMAQLLRAHAGNIREVLDIGASTGVTTVELADFLSGEKVDAKITATDLFVEAHLVALGPHIRVLADGEGWPLQYDLAGRAVRAWVRRLDYVSLMCLPRQLARTRLQPYLRGKIEAGRSVPVRMETRSLASHGITLVENDIFVPTTFLTGRFDFIRAANVLNRGYFSDRQIELALANIRAYCRGPGALVLIIRSGSRDHDGTMFELDPRGRFELRARIGEGSEIERLVLSLAPKQDTLRARSEHVGSPAFQRR
ncbi:class I SAM-dependent methyltransferase [Pararhizobium mangrovi]|uniref:class I SAM-dependent methyltransferase n=1 Tax=Pararhizobium mangrovi TaxID=2590452 RepID=UPI001F458CC1|nr:class I SAM-dependent methyltransferase [Pararhizobium mangrovi]